MIRQLFRRKFVRDTLALQIGKIGTTGMSLLSSLLVVRLMGAETYGVWALAQSFFTIWQTLNLTGVNISTSTRLAIAVGAKDEQEILNLTAFYVQVSLLWAALLTTLIALTGPFLSRLAYNGDTRIGILAVLLSLSGLPDDLYGLVTIALQSQRSMQTLAILSNLNQFIFLLCTVAALVINPIPESLIIGRLVFSISTMFLAFWFYDRERTRFNVPFPPLHTVFGHARHISPRRYWRFGFLNAVDKNMANLYTEIPLQMAGIFAGKAAAGYLEAGFKALTVSSTLTSAVYDNLQAVIPQAVGRRDFANLRRNLTHLIVTLSLAAVVFYTLFALAVPLIVLLFGQRWLPASPVIATLAIYGGVAMVGGIFGPLYRALNLLRAAITGKIIALVAVIVPGAIWISHIFTPASIGTIAGLSGLSSTTAHQSGALVGAWMVNSLYIISTLLTVIVTLPALNAEAQQQKQVEH
jgi:O-antigen/teichoic acid export membrane protein